MLNNLITTAIRNFVKDKGYTLLNVLGLTIGITFSMLLIFYVLDEMSYDKHHKNANRIVRVVSYAQEPTKSMRWAVTQFPLAPTLKKDYPEVEEAVRFVISSKKMYSNGETKFYEEKIYYADSTLFNIFTHPFLEGNAKTALTAPNSMVLTQALAKKYFGEKTALGQSLRTSTGDVYKITGVIKNVPKNSHITFDGLISISSLPKDFSDSWGSFGHYTYVLLKPGVDRTAFEKKLAPMYNKFMAPLFAQYDIKIHYGVQPITDIHLHSDMTAEPEELGSMSYIYIFSSVAFFMLLIACINYMNLTTARSARRAKEIGVRKVAGCSKTQLVAQFLVESVFITVISLLLSLGLLSILFPAFNTLSGKQLLFSNIFQPISLLVMFGIILFVGLIGGSYPAFYLAKFNPVAVLKGSLSKGSSNVVLRRVLVTTQFSISMVMIICTWVIYSQLQYMREKDLGFNKEQVVSLNVNGDRSLRSKMPSFKNALRNNPHVKSVSSSNAVPGGEGLSFNLFAMETEKGFTEKGVNNYGIDENYITTLGMKIVKGRNFTSTADTLRSILVNESMVSTFGWKEPLGKKIKFPGDSSGSYVEVVGVVKDFHHKSLYNPIEPLVLFYSPVDRRILVKVEPSDITTTIKGLESIWKEFFPSLPFQYTFLDDDYNSQYQADQKRGQIFTAFSILTIFITCLGLVGLIAFTTQQRQREISIRKVMGAGLSQIVALVAKNFVVLVVCSCLIAFPIAYYFMHRWLEIFPYKAELRASTFLISAVIILLITVITISFHTIKVAIANPVKSLRTE